MRLLVSEKVSGSLFEWPNNYLLVCALHSAYSWLAAGRGWRCWRRRQQQQQQRRRLGSPRRDRKSSTGGLVCLMSIVCARAPRSLSLGVSLGVHLQCLCCTDFACATACARVLVRACACAKHMRADVCESLVLLKGKVNDKNKWDGHGDGPRRRSSYAKVASARRPVCDGVAMISHGHVPIHPTCVNYI